VYAVLEEVSACVARAFVREGARVFLAGRTLGGLEQVAALDAVDAGAIDRHADDVVAAAGSFDVSFNLIFHAFVHGTPLVDMSVEVALHAVEAMRRQLATELGEHGVRVVTLLTSGIPRTIPGGRGGGVSSMILGTLALRVPRPRGYTS
jgi:3-oxoacyl-[acyl-carrier protein] reductase